MRATGLITHAGTAAGLFALAFGISVADGDVSWFGDPEGILLWASAPGSATVGERLTLMITIENTRQEAPFFLKDIDIAGDYLQGFTIEDVQPAPVNSDTVNGDLTLEYNTTIPARSSQRFYIQLLPETPGVYVGDVDVWGTEEEEESRFCTARAQTKVE